MKKVVFNGKSRIKVINNYNELYIENNTDYIKYILINKFFYNKSDKYLNIHFNGENYSGKEPELKIINRLFKATSTLNFGKKNILQKPTNFFVLGLKMYPHSKNKISILKVDYLENEKENVFEDFNNDSILISPGYPSNNNKYLFGFVHTRVKEYLKNSIKLDVVSLSDKSIYQQYNFEEVKVSKMNYVTLRDLLLTKKYKKILIHFFTLEIAQILDAIDKTDLDITIFTHGSDLLYRDYPIITKKYFELQDEEDKELKDLYDKKDSILKRYNEMPNVKFVFATNWAKGRCEEENNIKLKNTIVIPTYIDNTIFNCKEKNSELRKKILIIRKFSNIDTYGVDLDVRTILELSKSKIFKELEFNIYGEGDYFEVLTKPIKDFKNVHLHNRFLTHEEISEIHKNNGIALFATRYETMGVSAMEAASSGLVVLSNKVAAVREVFDDDLELLSEKEDYKDMAKKIEMLVNDPELFINLSNKCKKIAGKFNFDNTIKKELDLFKTEYEKEKITIKRINKNKILTIAIASYNVENYLKNGVYSLLKSKYKEKLEVLIINDGSKDKTKEVGKSLENISTFNGESIVKLIDKENGGHGSAINKGIELAQGKYFKLMDGDDYFDTDELDKLIEVLEKEDSDIILNNYVEDLSKECKFNIVKHYDFMRPAEQYLIEDLCYDHYGFTEWGPLLSTSTFKTKMLKDSNFKISEKCFYVDMELNSLAFSLAKTISYYPFNIYIYYIGREGQSVSPESFRRNYKNHEHVIFRILNDIYYKIELSKIKKNYLKEKILIPLINGQYYITLEYFKDNKPFYEFDSKLKEYSEFYYNPKISVRKINIYRKTNGKFKSIIKTIVKIKSIIRKVVKRGNK